MHDRGVEWGFTAGTATVTNTMHLDDSGQWIEVTDVVIDGGTTTAHDGASRAQVGVVPLVAPVLPKGGRAPGDDVRDHDTQVERNGPFCPLAGTIVGTVAPLFLSSVPHDSMMA